MYCLVGSYSGVVSTGWYMATTFQTAYAHVLAAVCVALAAWATGQVTAAVQPPWRSDCNAWCVNGITQTLAPVGS